MLRSPSELMPGAEIDALLPRRAAGLGVGLAVVKVVVEQCGGTLTVESLEGQGTSFLAVLPRYDINDFLNSDL